MHLPGWLLSYLSFINLQQTFNFFFKFKNDMKCPTIWITQFKMLVCHVVQTAASSFFWEFKFKIGSSLINYMINFILNRVTLFKLIKHQLWWGPRLIVWIIKHQLLVSVTDNGQGKRLDWPEPWAVKLRRIVWLTNFVDYRFCIFTLRLVGSTRVPIFWYR